MKRIFSLFKKKKNIKDNRRAFTSTQKTFLWYNQNGKCKNCNEILDLRTVKYDHIIRHSQGGLTNIDNGQALCANCHSYKTYEENLELINKTK